MGIRINTNIASLQGQNNLAKSGLKLNNTLYKLSTGLRINSGKDDVVGLSKSESLRSNIRGISFGINNIGNAESVLGIAEGSLANLTDVIQQIREKVLQAADGTISANDRTNIDSAIDGLSDEYTRLASSAEFDGVKLLDGTFISKLFQVGPKGGDTISVSLSDVRSSAIGSVYTVTAAQQLVFSNATTTAALTHANGFTLNSVSVGAATSSDNVSSISASSSAIAMVNYLNSLTTSTGVSARVEANTVSVTVAGGGFSVGAFLTINGVTVHTGQLATTSASTLATSINSYLGSTGVAATYSGTVLTLAAYDGRNIQVATNQGGANTSSIAFGFLSGTTYGSASKIYRAAFRLYSDSSFTFTGHTLELNLAATTTSASTSTAATLSALNTGSSANAIEGLFILDNVLRQLQQRRTTVGSSLIRFGAAKNELQARLENVTAAESLIRDADIAKETADLTSLQILQQAGVTVLSRANAIPQIALSLLQA